MYSFLDIPELQKMLNIFEQDILKWSLYIDFSILNIEIITFNSDPSTTTEPRTDATTPVNTNNGSKDNWKDKVIGFGIPALIVIIIIIIIIIYFVIKRGNKHDNVKTPKHDNSNKTWEPTVNKSDNP